MVLTALRSHLAFSPEGSPKTDRRKSWYHLILTSLQDPVFILVKEGRVPLRFSLHGAPCGFGTGSSI